MILHTKRDIDKDILLSLKESHQAVEFDDGDRKVFVTPSSIQSVLPEYKQYVLDSYIFDSDIQLASRGYISDKRKVDLGKCKIGGNTGNTAIIAGPCSVESREQLYQTIEKLSELGVKTIRAGCFKPRTSPYSFQGMGLEGLKILREIGDLFGCSIVTEVRDSTHVVEVIEHSDIVQIGAKAMYDQGILRACAKSIKPILLKRGFGSTLQEFVQAAEFILCGGNPNVILCERGIRTFETKTRFTLDLCGVEYLKQYTNLPIVLDPSHAMGYSYGVAGLSRACVALGVDGMLIETHPDPSVAKSDAAQQLDLGEFETLYAGFEAVAHSVGMKIV